MCLRRRTCSTYPLGTPLSGLTGCARRHPNPQQIITLVLGPKDAPWNQVFLIALCGVLGLGRVALCGLTVLRPAATASGLVIEHIVAKAFDSPAERLNMRMQEVKMGTREGPRWVRTRITLVRVPEFVAPALAVAP